MVRAPPVGRDGRPVFARNTATGRSVITANSARLDHRKYQGQSWRGRAMEARIKAGDRGTVVEVLGSALVVDVVDPENRLPEVKGDTR